ncbi:MAG: hypothetical protein M1151_00540 [Candidatus Thermoplasmatota archaeon]|jgi:hypothetical protein|nr:hypothetical protein [Candidatus Thermoplasmatota archaeon]MCL5785142.1 hypothetical protein [Candidatus Thermoplasmatota archaeon]
MIAVNELRETLPVERISRALDIPRSFIYYSRSGHTGKGNGGYPATLRNRYGGLRERELPMDTGGYGQ